MRREEFTFFEIFQNLIFKIIAFILFATTPLIFPGEPKNVDPQAPALIEEVNSLSNETRALEGRQQELQQETANRREEAERVESRLRQAETRQDQEAQSDKQQQALQAQLQREIQAKKRDIERLQGELAGVEGRDSASGKFTPVKKSSKQDVAVQLTGNHLYPVDDAHFTSRQIFATVAGGNIVPVVVKVRKANVTGERLDDLERPDSKFHKLIQKLNPQKERLYLLVNRDSFPILRKARNILDRQGIEYGWWPWPRKEVVFGGGGGDRLPSTSQ